MADAALVLLGPAPGAVADGVGLAGASHGAGSDGPAALAQRQNQRASPAEGRGDVAGDGLSGTTARGGGENGPAAGRKFLALVRHSARLYSLLDERELGVRGANDPATKLALVELAREWVRGINHLPLGGKHRHLLMLARKHAAAPEAPTTVARGSTLVHAQPPLPPPPQSLQLEAMGMAEEDDPSVAEAEARRKKRHSEAVFARPVASLDELLDD